MTTPWRRTGVRPRKRRASDRCPSRPLPTGLRRCASTPASARLRLAALPVAAVLTVSPAEALLGPRLAPGETVAGRMALVSVCPHAGSRIRLRWRPPAGPSPGGLALVNRGEPQRHRGAPRGAPR